MIPRFTALNLILMFLFAFGTGFFVALNDSMHNAFFIQNFYLVVIIGIVTILSLAAQFYLLIRADQRERNNNDSEG